jgi:hypothetical protein
VIKQYLGTKYQYFPEEVPLDKARHNIRYTGGE